MTSKSTVPSLELIADGRRAATAGHQRTLVLNLPKSAPDLAVHIQTSAPIYTHFALLTRDMIERLAPVSIIAPLIADHFDILDVALFLQQIRFPGDLRILSRPLPRADLVMAEIRALCPDVSITLLSLG